MIGHPPTFLTEASGPATCCQHLALLATYNLERGLETGTSSPLCGCGGHPTGTFLAQVIATPALACCGIPLYAGPHRVASKSTRNTLRLAPCQISRRQPTPARRRPPFSHPTSAPSPPHCPARPHPPSNPVKRQLLGRNPPHPGHRCSSQTHPREHPGPPGPCRHGQAQNPYRRLLAEVGGCGCQPVWLDGL